jgi:hypothetical protein
MFLLSNGVWGVTAGYPKGMALGTQKPKDMNICGRVMIQEGPVTRIVASLFYRWFPD